MLEVILDGDGYEILSTCPNCDSEHVSDWDAAFQVQECFDCQYAWGDEEIMNRE